MKKVLCLLLAAILVLGLVACGNSNAGQTGDVNPNNSEPVGENSTTPTGPAFTIGYPAVPATNTAMEAMKLNRTIVAEAMGGQLITEEWDFSAEGTIQAVEKLIERGCNGVIVTPTDESILPTIAAMCEDAGVYWAIAMRTIKDETIKEIVYASKYYVGYVYEPGIEIGKDLAEAAVEAGCKKYAIITGPAGDTDATIREEGIRQVAEANGMECVGTIRAVASAADAAAAVESLLAANPDLDTIIRVTSNVAGDAVAVCQAIEESGKKDSITFISFNTEEGMEQYIENGVCDVAFTSQNVFDSVMAATILCNQLVGTPVSAEKIELNIGNARIGSLKDLENYNKYIETTEQTVYSKEEVQEILMGISLENLLQIVEGYSIESVTARKEK